MFNKAEACQLSNVTCLTQTLLNVFARGIFQYCINSMNNVNLWCQSKTVAIYTWIYNSTCLYLGISNRLILWVGLIFSKLVMYNLYFNSSHLNFRDVKWFQLTRNMQYSQHTPHFLMEYWAEISYNIFGNIYILLTARLNPVNKRLVAQKAQSVEMQHFTSHQRYLVGVKLCVDTLQEHFSSTHL